MRGKTHNAKGERGEKERVYTGICMGGEGKDIWKNDKKKHENGSHEVVGQLREKKKRHRDGVENGKKDWKACDKAKGGDHWTRGGQKRGLQRKKRKKKKEQCLATEKKLVTITPFRKSANTRDKWKGEKLNGNSAGETTR